jgi:hypothetical protein
MNRATSAAAGAATRPARSQVRAILQLESALKKLVDFCDGRISKVNFHVATSTWDNFWFATPPLIFFTEFGSSGFAAAVVDSSCEDDVFVPRAAASLPLAKVGGTCKERERKRGRQRGREGGRERARVNERERDRE